MSPWHHELGLLHTLLLNAAVLGCAYRLARRRGGGGALQAACDAFLLGCLVQYAAVGLTGAAGAFNVWTMSLVALAAAAGMWVLGGRRETSSDDATTARPSRKSASSTSSYNRASSPPRAPNYASPSTPSPVSSSSPTWTWDHFGLVACAAFVACFVAAHVHDQRFHPPVATDALVYHLSTAVQWIQTGRLGLFGTWYWNPAATYSPATSSTFMAWLMAPSGNDVFVRAVQAPVVLWIFLLTARLCRLFGCGRTVAGLVGVAAAMSRPFVSETVIPKDDLFITAFFASAVLSLTPGNLRDRLGPWRVGLAFGMVLACKYTVLIACPLFLFMADAPFRAKWHPRDWAIALSLGAVLFAPWYVRNVVLTGNPLYPVDVKPFGVPIFEGLFGTERDQQLRTAGGVWRMLGTTYHSLSVELIVVVALGWVAALFATGRAALRDPLARAALVGTPVTIALFLLTSPHHEVRYVYPLLPLLFGVVGLAVVRWIRPEPARAAVAAAAALASVATSFNKDLAGQVVGMLAPAVLAAGAISAAVVLQCRVLRLDRARLAITVGVLALLAAMPTYVWWGVYVDQYYRKRSDNVGEPGISFVWNQVYAREARLWTFVRDKVPEDATLAIANTFFVYPFQDERFRRRLGHAPVLRGLHEFRNFPRMGDTVPGDVIVTRMTQVQNADPDKATWLENLRRLGAQYLVIATFEHEPNPPERRFVAEEPGRFELLFDDATAGAVYRIKDLQSPTTAPASTSPSTP